ncbi:trypsin delta-like [Microplitis mediator]|uniref:trypsin delta-like n=1 Tax=Microplitis mediator TaxID=375433 RepID=UPI00255503DF|nr:trypsin delta-like [Microplitis mediator]
MLTIIITSLFMITIPGISSSRLDSNHNENLAPYIVSIQLNSVHICSGVIVTSREILTLASCVFPFVDNSTHKLVEIRIGSKNRYRDGSKYYISSVKVHEYFLKSSSNKIPAWDIAIIRVSQRIIFDKTRNRTCIGLKDTDKSTIIDKQGIVVEWISNKFDTSYSQQLTNWKIISDTECNDQYDDFDNVTSIARICAINIDRTGDVNACPTDLGNPLMINGELVGIKMWPKGCKDLKKPFFFRNVRDYFGWIHNHTDHTVEVLC